MGENVKSMAIRRFVWADYVSTAFLILCEDETKEQEKKSKKLPVISFCFHM